MHNEEDVQEGWWWPSNARKAHYMVNNRSLCGRWGSFASLTLKQGNDASRNNCAECKRRLARQKCQ